MRILLVGFLLLMASTAFGTDIVKLDPTLTTIVEGPIPYPRSVKNVSNPTELILRDMGYRVVPVMPSLQEWEESTLIVVGGEVEWSVSVKPLNEIKALAKERVKYLRDQYIAQIESRDELSSAVFQDAYDMVDRYEHGDNSLGRTGLTPLQYFQRKADARGVTVSQAVAYVKTLVEGAAAAINDIDNRHLALLFAGDATNSIVPIDSLTTVPQVRQAVADFKTYCEGVVGQ